MIYQSRCFLISNILALTGLAIVMFLQLLQTKYVSALDCEVPTGLYPTIQSAVGNTSCSLINLTAPLYVENVTITRSLTIQGQGVITTTVDGGGNGRVFTIQPSLTVTLTDMLITNGFAPPIPPVDEGGGIYNSNSHLTLQNTDVFSNFALSGAGIYNTGDLHVLSTIIRNNSTGYGSGGGILNVGGNVTIIDSQILNNFADDLGGGGVWSSGVVVVADSIISGNTTFATGGGGIYSGGILTITNSTISDNSTQWDWGGGVLNHGAFWLIDSSLNNNSNYSGNGGGIFNDGELIAENSTFDENFSGISGSGILNIHLLTVNNSTFSNNTGSSTLNHASSQASIISNSIFSNNTGAGVSNSNLLTLDNVILESNTGRGIVNTGILTVTGSVLTGNSGGIYNSGSLTVINSHLEQNSTKLEGGGIYNSSGSLTLLNSMLYNNSANEGGGIWNGEATVHIIDSVLYENNASSEGGGIYNSRAMWPGVVIITNTTFYSNSAIYGGGLFNNGGQFTSINNTINGNSANEGGGLYNSSTNGSLIQLTNTIVANSSSGGDCGGSTVVISLGHNIASDNTCNLIDLSDMPNTDPMLGPLQGNGGSTWTHALLAESPAIDTGNNVDCPATDQRGESRPQDGDGDNTAVCDIGSYELILVSSPLVSIIDRSIQEGNSNTATATFTVSLSISSTFPITINYSTLDETAIALTDYISVSGTLIFTPGALTQTIEVLINGDTNTEPDETFLVILSNPFNAILDDEQAIGTILNDDLQINEYRLYLPILIKPVAD